ncbi:MAG: T9SS type A sorting domain-containing protein [Bacteroidales bacterium]|nr:T9SS type A sorting domain-containing protein [Bacteroidales bacterium]MBN2764273.1 T9SS type A sorting domain-containing protein [Bacteroidales bacterium]
MKTLIYSTLLISLCLGLMAQNPGDLNTDFAAGGVFTERWNDTVSQVYDIGMLPDGNLILPGYYATAESVAQKVFVMNMDEQGNIPPFGNFSRGFKYELLLYGYATSVFILPDNKMLIAGNYMPAFSNQPFVIRLNSNGQIDDTFADHGVFVDEDIYLKVNDIDVFYDGDSYKIILCGENDGTHPQIIMINEDGSLETSFNTTGIISYDAYVGYFTDIIVDNESDQLYVCIALADMKAALLKYNLPDGGLDPTFGVGGILSTIAFEDINLTFNTIIFNKDSDNLTAFGKYQHTAGDLDMCALRVNASDGSIDLSFGLNGWAWLRSAGSDEDILAAVQQSDGKYYVGGYTDYLGMDDFMLGRLKANGTSDNTFGTGGLVITEDFFDERIAGLALSPSEDVLYAAGYSFSTDWRAIMVAAYHTGYEPEEPQPPVGFKEDQTSLVGIYPNPAVDNITINTGKAGIHRIRILDMAGRIMLERDYKGKSFNLNMEELLPSLYFIEVTLPCMDVVIEKIIKQ